jgi:hypothetical protein
MSENSALVMLVVRRTCHAVGGRTRGSLHPDQLLRPARDSRAGPVEMKQGDEFRPFPEAERKCHAGLRFGMRLNPSSRRNVRLPTSLVVVPQCDRLNGIATGTVRPLCAGKRRSSAADLRARYG